MLHDSPLSSLIWIGTCTALVQLMQSRFTWLETGLVRAKSSVNVTLKNVVDFCIASIVFCFFGFALRFRVSAWRLFGTDHFLSTVAVEPHTEVG